MTAPKPVCGSCASGASLFCATEAAFYCGTCDSTAHGTNASGRSEHGRHALCDLCEGSPAVVYCRNDAARLCASCDAQIHLSNPLAARHERVALTAFVFPETEPKLDGTPAAPLSHASSNASMLDLTVPQPEKELPASTFDPGHTFKDFDAFDLEGTLFDVGMGFDMGGLDMDFLQGAATDGVVPNMNAKAPVAPASVDSSSCCSSGVDTAENSSPVRSTSSVSSGCTFPAAAAAPAAVAKPASPTASCPVAGMPALPTAPVTAAGAWPAGFNVPQEVLHVGEGTMTRESRVQRYREKRARRSFQKTIRYQSRKAYAEIRPRIKGRFATKEEVIALRAEQALGAAASCETSIPIAAF